MKARTPRPRIHRADAALVRSRVEAAAAPLGLRCGLRAVFQAVLTLTVGHNKLVDDPRMHHIGRRLPAGARALSATTIGRLLAQLASLELIVYTPARGRGRSAEVAIHPRFSEGVRQLDRDQHGKVIIPDRTPTPGPEPGPKQGSGSDLKQGSDLDSWTSRHAENVEFSGPSYLYKGFPKRTSCPTAPTNGSDPGASGRRPIEVDVEHRAAGRVLAAIPACYRQAPWPVRRSLYRAIHAQLKRGWREDQVIDVLAAPLPSEVRRPLVLARVRFAKSQPGAGPRLQPLQQAWERARDAARTAGWAGDLAAQYAAIVDEVGPDVAQRMAFTDRHRTGEATPRRTPQALEDEQLHDQRAAVNAARVIRRDYPGEPLQIAVRRWLAVHEPHHEEAAPQVPSASAGDLWLTIEDLISATPSGRCVSCGCVGAITREDLPAPAPVCEDCWEALSQDDPDSDYTAAAPASPMANAGWVGLEAC